MGKGGAGQFKPADSLSPAEAAKSWRYTRLNEHQKDTPKHASGGIVLGPVPPEEDQWQQIKISTLRQIEEAVGGEPNLTIYGHSITRGSKKTTVMPGEPQVSWAPKMQENSDGSSFSALCIGQWQLSHEVQGPKRQMECVGLLRPAFELFLNPSDRMLSPSASPDANVVMLFLMKKIASKAKGLIAF